MCAQIVSSDIAATCAGHKRGTSITGCPVQNNFLFNNAFRFECGNVANIVHVMASDACKFLVALRIVCKVSRDNILSNIQIHQPAKLLYDNSSTNSNETTFGDNLLSIMSLSGGNDAIARSMSATKAISTILSRCVSSEFWSQPAWPNEVLATKLQKCTTLIGSIMDRLTCNIYAIALLLNRDNEEYAQIREYQKANGGVAGALYITQSLINHSCVPNCEITYDGNCSEIRLHNSINVWLLF
jgi:hypothetical protein